MSDRLEKGQRVRINAELVKGEGVVDRFTQFYCHDEQTTVVLMDSGRRIVICQQELERVA